jgi:hypothetical protein
MEKAMIFPTAGVELKYLLVVSNRDDFPFIRTLLLHQGTAGVP